MNYLFPEEFIKGKAAIRVGYDAAEFIQLFNESIYSKKPSFAGRNDVKLMLERYGNDLTLDCEKVDSSYSSYRLCYCSAKWYQQQGYAIIDYRDLTPPLSIEGILDLL